MSTTQLSCQWQNLSDFEPIRHWTYLIPNLSDYKLIRYVIPISVPFPFKSLDTRQPLLTCPLAKSGPKQVLIFPFSPSKLTMTANPSQPATPAPYPPPFPAHNDRQPLPARPVVKSGPKQVHRSPLSPSQLRWPPTSPSMTWVRIRPPRFPLPSPGINPSDDLFIN